MKISLYSFLILLFLLFSCSTDKEINCSEKSFEMMFYELQGNVKSVVIEKWSYETNKKHEENNIKPSTIDTLLFDEKGKLIYHHQWYDENKIFGSEPPMIYEFSENGQLIGVSSHYSKYEIIEEKSDNCISIIEKSNYNDSVISTFKYLYDTDGKHIAKIKFDNKMDTAWSYRYFYDENSCLQEYVFENANKIIKRLYNDDGLIFKEYNYSSDQDYYIETKASRKKKTWKFDLYTLPENKLMTRMPDDEGKKGENIKIEYYNKFDKKGNYIYREERLSYSELTDVINRKIVYYD